MGSFFCNANEVFIDIQQRPELRRSPARPDNLEAAQIQAAAAATPMDTESLSDASSEEQEADWDLTPERRRRK